jgi:hypothetical protein
MTVIITFALAFLSFFSGLRIGNSKKKPFISMCSNNKGTKHKA